jgi:hypothetical protein
MFVSYFCCLVFGLALSDFGIKKLPSLSPKHSNSNIQEIVLFGFVALSCLLKFCLNSWLLALLCSFVALTALMIIAIFISKDRSLRINLIAFNSFYSMLRSFINFSILYFYGSQNSRNFF